MSNEYKKYKARYQKYAKSDRGKAANKKYRQSRKGKLVKKKAILKYRQTVKGKRVYKSCQLKIRYGITFKDYKYLIKNQNYMCAICSRKSPGKNKEYFYVDHNHKTGEVRGLLCYKCNIMLGFADDNIKILRKAINYLGIK